MKDKILTILQDGHMTSAASLAAQLGLSEAETDKLLEEMAREGLVKKRPVAISKEDIRDGSGCKLCEKSEFLVFWETA